MPWLEGEKPTFPKDGVLAKTFYLEMEAGNAASAKKMETQVLHFDGRNWHGYTYAWDEGQSDAALVDAGGRDRTVLVRDAKAPAGKREQVWHYASRAQCAMCRASLSGSNNATFIRNLNIGVLVLLVPPVTIFCSIFVVLRKFGHRDE